MRVGIGHDVHELVSERRLVLGGVDIPFEKGLTGHSDADVLTHAVCDALLGAAGLGDIGSHFPDTDNAYKGISSLLLLKKTYEIIRQKGYGIENLDMTVFAQSPKLSSYREKMENSIAMTIGIEAKLVNVKFKTTEGLGFIGEGKGMAAVCIALLK